MRSTLKIPSRVPPNFSQQDLHTRSPTDYLPPGLSSAGFIYEILNSVFLDLYQPQQYQGPRLGQIVHRRNQSSSLLRISIPKQKSEIPKQSIRIFFKMDMF